MKKGFTLVEIIATIVVLALILLITVPIINDTIEYSKRNTALQSIDLYISGVNDTIIASLGTDNVVKSKVYEINVDYSNMKNNDDLSRPVSLNNGYGAFYNGNMPDNGGHVYIANKKVMHYDLSLNGYRVIDGYAFNVSEESDLPNLVLNCSMTSGRQTKVINENGNFCFYNNGELTNYYIHSSDSSFLILNGAVYEKKDINLALLGTYAALYENEVEVLNGNKNFSGSRAITAKSYSIGGSNVNVTYGTVTYVSGIVSGYEISANGYTNRSGDIK